MPQWVYDALLPPRATTFKLSSTEVNNMGIRISNIIICGMFEVCNTIAVSNIWDLNIGTP